MKTFKQYFVESTIHDFAKSKGYNVGVVYHGSPHKFNVFNIKKLGELGQTLGYGFYFTDNRKVAEKYAKGTDNVYEVFLRIKKPLSDKRRTLTRSHLQKFIRAWDPQGEKFLDNYAEVDYFGYDRVLKEAILALFEYHDNDVDLISDIINSSTGGKPEEFYKYLTQTLGFDSIISEDESQTIYIVFHPNQIKLAGQTKDDSERVIPQSKRFDKNSDDIRY